MLKAPGLDRHRVSESYAEPHMVPRFERIGVFAVLGAYILA